MADKYTFKGERSLKIIVLIVLVLLIVGGALYGIGVFDSDAVKPFRVKIYGASDQASGAFEYKNGTLKINIDGSELAASKATAVETDASITVTYSGGTPPSGPIPAAGKVVLTKTTVTLSDTTGVVVMTAPYQANNFTRNV